MCVCMHACAWVRMCIYMHIVCVGVGVLCARACVWGVCTCVRACVSVYMCVSVRVCSYECVHVHV